jgi:hypothetical protein
LGLRCLPEAVRVSVVFEKLVGYLGGNKKKARTA